MTITTTMTNGISAQGLDIETWDFHKDVKDIKGIYLDNDDDNNNEDNEGDKNKEEDNHNDKGISGLGLDRDLVFLRGQ